MIEKSAVVKEEGVKITMIEMGMIVMIMLMKYVDEGDEESGEGAGCCQCFMELHFLSM
jgi:hypothetical protein